MSDNEELNHDDETQALFESEAKIMQVAHSDIVKYPPVTMFPPAQAARMLKDYEKYLIAHAGLSRPEVEQLVMNDLKITVASMRSTLVNLDHIGPVRAAVLLHVALFMGVDKLRAMKDLFTALYKRDYDGAYRALMLSAWPGFVGINENERIRVLNLADQMRSGVAS